MRHMYRFAAVVLAFAVALTLPVAGWAADEETTPEAAAKDSLTLKIYPRVSHEKILGLVIPWGKPEIVTVYDYRIADMSGEARDHVLLETAAGVTRLKFDDIRRIDYVSYPRHDSFSQRMDSVLYTVRANVFLTDGTRIENAIINAHLGTFEGRTELGKFFLDDPLTLASLTFNAH